jgi:2-polyprenyl-3-methyl-5-hydroxy-6-metoxy-1,4-benzoquinol methylase
MAIQNPIIRGGPDLERVYLYDLDITADGRRRIVVKKSNFSAIKNMGDVNMRHAGRYGLALPYIRPGSRILDFPCGSGLALEVFSDLARFGSFFYEGWDSDEPTIIYAREIYGKGRPWVRFDVRDLANFELNPGTFDTICCIEGIEHIDPNSQVKACAQFARGLASRGTLIVSSPSPETESSNPNPQNPFHVWELTKSDLLELLGRNFGPENVELISQKNVLSTGQLLTTFYVICHKP